MNRLEFLKGRNIIAISDFTRIEIEQILDCCFFLKQDQTKPPFSNFVMASCFFEPSTRTKLSFDYAFYRLGGNVIGFSSEDLISMKKGESLSDTMRIIGAYCDVVIFRHSGSGSAYLAADAAKKPLINAGDGVNQHPTQTLLDLFTILECHEKIDGLHIGVMGDLKYGRTVHSLIEALSLFDVELSLIAPKSLHLPNEFTDLLDQRKINYQYHDQFANCLPDLDILYTTRLQRERFNEEIDPNYHENYQVNVNNLTALAKKSLKVLHPLPRVNEICVQVDNTPYAFYFEQAANGVPVRQALLAGVLGFENFY